MKNQKSLKSVFKLLFPFITIVSYLIAFAVIFDTVNLDLFSALYNILLSLPLFGLLLMITRRFPVAALLTSVVAFVLFYVDQYVFSARLTHIRFSDLWLISQAVRVAGRYPLIWNGEITRRLLIAAALCAFLIFLSRYYKLRYSKKLVFFVGLGLFVISCALILSGVLPSAAEDYDFSRDSETRGLLYSWYCQAKQSRLEEPEGYTKAEAERILAQYTPEEPRNDDINVLVIMNESLADYSLIGAPRFDDPLPFIHSLNKNSFEGKLVVDVFGGGTAETEYAFLTGHALAFLPDGVCPYLQYVNRKTDNLASELGALGYDKTAIHPYFSEEWNRSQVYQFFDFDRFISGVDFGNTLVKNRESATAKIADNLMSFGDGPQYVRGLISDQTDVERVLSELGEKSFIFNVTMQNHGGYEYAGEDFTSLPYVDETIREDWQGSRILNGMLYSAYSSSVEEEIRKVNQYLTCANLSDQAFQYLLGELEKSEKKTIVLMFGDHQPSLLISEHFVEVDRGIDPDYTVPYILWANFDIEFDAPEITSPNYLSAILKKNAGLPLTAWDQFRLDVMQEYPVVSTHFILDKDGNLIDKAQLREYEFVQYMRLFDK